MPKPHLTYADQSVLITGASAGIGAELARELASRGCDLALVARRADRLETLAAELRRAHGVRVEVVPTDLARAGVGQELAAELDARGMPVTAVVNNAGFGNHGPFHEMAPEDLAAEIAVDVAAVVDISRAFVERLRGGAGFLVNVASLTAYQANPALAVYGASKAFVLSFTEALWYEAKGTGLRVLAVSPGATETEFFDVAGESAAGGTPRMTAGDVVATTLATLERRNPPPSVVVGRLNAVSAVGSRLGGRRLSTTAVGMLMDRARRSG